MRIVLFLIVAACGSGVPAPATPPANHAISAPAPATHHVPTGFDADLAVFRAAAGKPWTPDNAPAMAAGSTARALPALTLLVVRKGGRGGHRAE